MMRCHGTNSNSSLNPKAEELIPNSQREILHSSALMWLNHVRENNLFSLLTHKLILSKKPS